MFGSRLQRTRNLDDSEQFKNVVLRDLDRKREREKQRLSVVFVGRDGSLGSMTAQRERTHTHVRTHTKKKKKRKAS